MSSLSTPVVGAAHRYSQETRAEIAPFSPALVLLVDDQPMVGEAVRRLIADEPDITLHYCARGADALTQADHLHPTVILQDLVLPDADGLDLVRQYRATLATANTPIIVLSTKEEARVKAQAFAAGANDYLVKLPERAELLARIRYHSRAYLSQQQRDEAFQALRDSQRQLLESNTSLLVVNQQLNQFVGMAAHDLRNPLSVVISYAKFLIHGKTGTSGTLDEQQREFLSKIHGAAEFMLALVNDLLDVSAIESGKLTIECQMAELNDLVRANVNLNRILASEKDIAITFTAAPYLPRMKVDTRRLEQVLTNLLTNAVKFSYPQSSVEVTLEMVGREVLLSVRDHGQGIPADEIGRLFTPFGVTSVRGTRGEKSAGLGLLIAKKVVDAHNGRIWVESKPGEGSTFFVALPINGQ